ncbi:MAG: GGDEF domain-containing protein [Colwellia sp.]
MVGLDIQTLVLSNIFLGLFLGVGSLVFSNIHKDFSDFKLLGLSYILFALGNFLLALRSIVPDFFSIVVANVLIATAISLLIIGILKFFDYEYQKFKSLSIVLIVLLLLSYLYLTYLQPNINYRIAVISAFIAGQGFFITFKIISNKDKGHFSLTQYIAYAFFVFALISVFRLYLSLVEVNIFKLVDLGAIHGLSLIGMQLITITSCFTLSLSASQQLADKLAIQATTDSLTGIYNRRAFDEIAENEILRAQRERKPISIVLMDIDFFKRVNDNYGHQTGDKVLQEFSQRLKSSLRQYDMLARYGGEEFILLLPNTPKDTAIIIAEKLRVAIYQPVFYLDDLSNISVSASFGVATNQGEHIDWQQLISCADQALYKAKENGRNQVNFYSAKIYEISHTEKSN